MPTVLLQRFRPEPPVLLARIGPDGRLAALAARGELPPEAVAIAPPSDFAGFGAIDYSDDQAGTAVELPAATWVTVTRALSASEANNRLQGPFAGHAFWNNASSKVQPRAAYDVLAMSFVIRIKAGTLGGSLEVQLIAGGAIEVDHRVHVLTGEVGQWDSVRIPLSAFVRNTFATQGAVVRLRCSVAAEFDRFSPEFYPMSRLAS